MGEYDDLPNVTQPSIWDKMFPGAPYKVRLAAGGREGADKLATVRAMMPNANVQPVENNEDNFTFTNKLGQRELYNPKGPDLGDLASLFRDAMVQGGGVAGGAGLGLAALPTAAGTGPVGPISAAVAGKMLGGAAGGQLADRVVDYVSGVPSSAPVSEQAAQMASDAVSLPMGEVIGLASM